MYVYLNKCFCQQIIDGNVTNNTVNISRKQDKAEHWIDYAASRYSPQLITGVKSLTGILVLFVPIIPFWALSDQQVQSFFNF